MDNLLMLCCSVWYPWKLVQKVSPDLLCPSHESLPSSPQRDASPATVDPSVCGADMCACRSSWLCTRWKALLSSCPRSSGKGREQVYKDMPGSSGYCGCDESGRIRARSDGTWAGSEAWVEGEPVHMECSGTSSLRWKNGVWQESVEWDGQREAQSGGLGSLMDMDSVQNACKDLFF